MKLAIINPNLINYDIVNLLHISLSKSVLKLWQFIAKSLQIQHLGNDQDRH